MTNVQCLNQYIRQCVENFNVLPIYCPDPKCRLNGFLEPGEIKAILLKHSSTQVVDKTNDSNNNHTQKDETEQFEDETSLSYYKKYLKVSENIGTNRIEQTILLRVKTQLTYECCFKRLLGIRIEPIVRWPHVKTSVKSSDRPKIRRLVHRRRSNCNQ